MKKRFLRILTAAVVLSLLMLAIPAVPVLAASVTLSPTSGAVGDEIDIKGYDFTDYTTDEYVDVYFSSDSASVGQEISDEVDTYDKVISAALLNSSDDFEDSFDVPSSMTDGTDDKTVTSGTYYVYTVYYEDTAYDIVTVDTFTVIAGEIELDDASGYVGDEVTVSGTDFADESEITVYFDSTAVDITDGDEETDDDGEFECSFVVPNAVRGSHTVKVEDEDDSSDTATYTVSQKITLDPASGSSATEVTITGTGFLASKDIDVSYDGVEVDISSGDVDTDSKGSFECTFTVPAGDAGTYEVEVSTDSYSATADFTYTTSATISQQTSAASPGHVGMQLTVSGTGFLPLHTVTITYASETTTFTVDTNSSGDFTKVITIPASEAGAHTITVSDGTNTITFPFYMEGNPPPVPSLALPAEAEKLKDGLFDWGDVVDSDNDDIAVTYDLQVATDSSFTTPLTKTGLATSTYTLSEAEKLESTGSDAPYYWRVRAVDAASNESAWTAPRTFTVGMSIEISGIAWIIIAAAAVVFFIIGLLVGRRGGGGGYY